MRINYEFKNLNTYFQFNYFGFSMKYLFLLILIFSISVFATESSPWSNIKVIQSYPDYGGGDVILTLDSSSSICKGFWLKKDSPGQETTFSMLLSAYHSKTKIKVWGHTDDSSKWPGSVKHFCRIYTVAYL